MTESERKVVFVVSDGTGETADKVLNATLLQFGVSVHERQFVRVRTPEELKRILEQALSDDALVVYTLVDPEMRAYFQEQAHALGVETADIIGTLMMKLSHFLGRPPLGMPGLRYQLDHEYFRRVEAIEFAVKNDDGQIPRNLPKADLVLVGLSRSSKTPLSTYLAQREGWKVANVPLVMGVDPPHELFEVPAKKVVGLVMDLETLVRIRRERLKQLGLSPQTDYALDEKVAAELDWCRSLYRRNPGWTIIEVAGRAVEETAALILKARAAAG